MVRKQIVPAIFSLALIFYYTSLAQAETVLLDFSSPQCGPCQQMRPIVRRLAAAGHRIRHIDVSREPQLAAQYQVRTVPTFIVLVDGRETARTRFTSFEKLQAMLAKANTSPAPLRRAQPLGQSPDNNLVATSNDRAPVTFADSSTPITNVPTSPQPQRIVEIQSPESVGNRNANPARQPLVRQPVVGSGSQANHQKLIEATVKISVDDPEGKSAGTGTIVDTRSGEALILTCGHIFRSSNGKGPIQVSMFRSGANGAEPVGRTYTGRLIDFDLERDLALVSIRPDFAVRPAPIAATNSLQPGAPVTTVGCNHGQNPTAINSKVTTIDRYEGPPNVEVAGMPVEGRSGGGLFNAQGELVGVCFAADPQANEGLYASIPSIHAKLDSLGLTMIYQTPSAANLSPASAPAVAATTNPSISVRGQEPSPVPPTAGPTTPTPTNLNPAERAALEEIQRRGTNSEVICIIRPQDPNGKSEVITLSNASPEFVEQLKHATASGPAGAPPSTAAAAGQLLR